MVKGLDNLGMVLEKIVFDVIYNYRLNMEIINDKTLKIMVFIFYVINI